MANATLSELNLLAMNTHQAVLDNPGMTVEIAALLLDAAYTAMRMLPPGSETLLLARVGECYPDGPGRISKRAQALAKVALAIV